MNFNRKVIECGAVASLVVAFAFSANVSSSMPTVASSVTETKTVEPEVVLGEAISSNLVYLNASDLTLASVSADTQTVATETAEEQLEEDNSSNNIGQVGLLASLETSIEFVSAASEKAESDTESEEESEETSEWDNMVMAKVEDYTNIRSAADADSELLGKLYKGSAAEIVEEGDEWTKIKSGSVEGYVANEYLAFGDEAEQLADEDCSKVATVTTTTLKVRKEESNDASILGLVAEGDQLTVTEDGDEWVAIDYDGQTAYVSSEYVSVTQVIGEAVSIEEEKAAEAAKAAAEAEAAAKAQAASVSSSSTTTSSTTTSSTTTSSTATSSTATSSTTTASTATTAAVSTTANTSDIAKLAAIIQCEAGGESYEGKLAVGAVVMNRVRSGSYPSTVEGVITQSGQFSPVSSGKYASVLASGASSACYQAAQAAYAGSSNIGSACSFRQTSTGISGTIIGNHVFF